MTLVTHLFTDIFVINTLLLVSFIGAHLNFAMSQGHHTSFSDVGQPQEVIGGNRGVRDDEGRPE